MVEIKRTIEKNHMDIKSKKKDTLKSTLGRSNNKKEKQIDEEVQEI